MADIDQLIQKIVSDPRITSSSNFASRIYRDEPILIPAGRMERYTPPKIREMRQLGKPTMSEAEIFYTQGKFMESFEDSFEYRGEVLHYFPTYRAMSDSQLRGYFSWRTKVRSGAVERTSLSFAFMHIYELLNRLGVETAEEGFRALKDFWTAYREIDSRIDNYMSLWLKDYVVYHNLDKSLLDGLSETNVDQAVVVLLDDGQRGSDEVFRALNSLSSYDLAESRFFKQYPDDVREAACRVFSAVSAYYNKNPKRSASEKLFGRMCSALYPMFRSAIVHQPPSRENRDYEIGPYHKYLCRNGGWTCERFVWYGKNNKRIGALLKTVDYLMRREYGFASALQPGKTNKILKGKIEKVIAAYREEKRKNAAPVIDIDVSKLHSIRAASLTTQTRLLVDERDQTETSETPASEAPPAAMAEETPEPGENAGGRAAGLDDMERRFVRRLLAGGSCADALQSPGALLSVVVDGINEKLFDAFGDAVIVDNGNGPEILDDYREELKGMIAP